MGFKMFSRAQLSPLCHSPVKTFNLVRLSTRLQNTGIMDCEAFHLKAIKFVLSKIKKDNSPGPMWLDHMCSINTTTIRII